MQNRKKCKNTFSPYARDTGFKFMYAFLTKLSNATREEKQR
jgi:hypothetical protein